MPDDDPEAQLRVPDLTPAARRILEVSGDLFYEHGIHAVGVDTIAAVSGVTKRTLYDRFGSKENLVAAYLQARHQRWWRCLEQRLERGPASPVLALFDSSFEDVEPKDRGCAFINAAGELPPDHPGRGVVRAHKRAVRARIGDLLRETPPAEGEPTAVADQVFLLLEGALAHRGIDADDRLVRSARRAVARLTDPR